MIEGERRARMLCALCCAAKWVNWESARVVVLIARNCVEKSGSFVTREIEKESFFL